MAKKLALLVGCNYPRTRYQLNGCINDVVAMEKVLRDQYGFASKNITVLIDDDRKNPNLQLPTAANIRNALNKMVKDAKAGDVLFFQFSGHGTIIPSLDSGAYKEDEAIVACDLNLITDIDLRKFIVDLKEGTSFTIFSDSCHSGGLIDKDKEQIGPSIVRNFTHKPMLDYNIRSIPIENLHETLRSLSSIMLGVLDVALPVIQASLPQLLNAIFNRDVSLKFHPDAQRNVRSIGEHEGILLSACQANETAADLHDGYAPGGKAYGAFTKVVLEILQDKKNDKTLTNKMLVKRARKTLEKHGFQQHPCLYCSDENADAPFLGEIKRSVTKIGNDKDSITSRAYKFTNANPDEDEDEEEDEDEDNKTEVTNANPAEDEDEDEDN